MASRRMFDREIMELDNFVDMPTSTRLLYVYICLDADDEGFLGSPKRVMRAFGGSEDDIKILIAKGFLVTFESGVVVITNWNEHNKIRADRIKPTRFTIEKEQLQVAVTQELNSRNDTLSTNGGHNDENCPHSIGKVSIGKVSIGKVSIDTPKSPRGKKEKVDLPNYLTDIKEWEVYVRGVFNNFYTSDKNKKYITVTYPNLNFIATLQLSLEYWKTEEAMEKKVKAYKKSKTKNLNWTSTIKTSINGNGRKIYHPKDFNNQQPVKVIPKTTPIQSQTEPTEEFDKNGFNNLMDELKI
jgi:hypothetical protein